MNNQLELLYYGLPRSTAYARADKLLQTTRKTFNSERVIEWLESQDAYNKHKFVRRRFVRRSYNVRNIDDAWEADLMDLRLLKTYNDGFTYILTVIDVLSKYVWIEPVETKSGNNVAKAFEIILTRTGGRKPICLQTDKGREFTNREFQQVLEKEDIIYRIVRSPDIKAAIVERVIRTIKERIWRFFTHTNTRRYIDVLGNIVDAYNHTKHSAIQMKPASVTIHNAAEARKNLKHRYESKQQPDVMKHVKYRVGDSVRVSRARNVFAKAYEGGWSEEVFKIYRISTYRYPVVYFLKDLAGEEIDGYFYGEELCKVRLDFTNKVFEIDQILKSRGRGRLKEYFVSWKGYPEKFNSWVKASDIAETR